MVKINAIICKQPIGNLYLFTLPASILKDLLFVRHRKDDASGVQRVKSSSRIKNIAKYSNSIDACFPTNILVNINANDVQIIGNTLELNIKPHMLEILDGQHRAAGFTKSEFDYEIPIGAFIGLSDKQKARVFKAINFNAKLVNKSHVYDMLSQTEDGTKGEQLGHQIANLFNNDVQSPFKGKIAMLGSGKGTWFNQANIVEPIARIADNGCLRNVDGEDAYICLLNYFKAWYQVFGEEFISNDSLIYKNFGIKVMFECFEPLYGVCHQPDGKDYDRFLEVVKQFKGSVWTKEHLRGKTGNEWVKIRATDLLALI